MNGRLIVLVILIGMTALIGCVPVSTETPETINTQVSEAVTLENPSYTKDVSEVSSEKSTQVEVQVSPSDTPQVVETEPTSTQPAEEGEPVVDSSILADVISVQVSGNEGAYRFSVGISSPDTGCDQYTDWWEVVSQDGELIYRRILLHSHVDEQPFVRSGGPVAISSDTVVLVRAHMNTGGYGGAVFKGSVEAGFVETDLNRDFAADLAEEAPLPEGCAF